MRCFISVPLPEKVKKEISRIQKQLPEVNMKKVDPANVHLTLKFLGELSGEQIENIKKEMGEINFQEFKLKLEQVGVFNPKFIRFVWIGLEESEELIKLKEKMENSLKEIVPRDKRKFSGHITIARVKTLSGIDKKDFLEKIEKLEINPIEFFVGEIKLKKSELNKQGPIYEDLFVKKVS